MRIIEKDVENNRSWLAEIALSALSEETEKFNEHVIRIAC
jgi:hypothetical protein